jgi:alpha-D-ribose 1-methylphosphonate 5-triphosphate synthase subunit PhnH
MSARGTPRLARAFADPVIGSQRIFRAVMDAMARPGTVVPLVHDLEPPPPLSPGAAALALTLCDYETPVWLDRPLAEATDVAAWLRFHTGAPLADDPQAASFALVADAADLPAFDAFALGSMEYPDRATTLILPVENFTAGRPLALSGPGIAGIREFVAAPLPADIVTRLAANRALFPRGIDLLLVTANAVAALPRSTRVAEAEGA